MSVKLSGVGNINKLPFRNPSEDQFYFKKNSTIFQKIAKRYGLKMEELNLEFRRRVQLVYKLYEQKIYGFEEVQNIINEYYKKPEEVLRKFGVE